VDDFEAALAAKVAASDEATTTEETPAEPEAENVEQEVASEETTEEQPRDDKGRFTSKFKSWEEAEKAAEEAQKVIGRQGSELGELRQMVEQIQARQEPQSFGKLQEALEENPQGVAMWALQNGNEEVLDKAIDAWYEKGLVEEDPRVLREVNRFERALEMAQFKNEFATELKPTLENVKSDAQSRAVALAQRELRANYPDFDQVMESVTEDDLQGLSPSYIRQLRDSDPKAAFEVMYRWKVSEIKNEEAAASDGRKAEVLEEKRRAVVASSTSSPVEGKKSGVDALKEFMLTPDEHSVHHGLVRD
jgi:hypothetical protein